MKTTLRLPTVPCDIDDPWNDDRLDREKIATFLTPLLVQQSDGCVLNIDSPWGTGKSFFLERWVASVMTSHPVVMFNAWSWDTGGDPLASLLSDLQSQIGKSGSGKQKVKKSVRRLVESSGRLLAGGASIALRAGMRRAVGDGGVEEIRDLLSPETEREMADTLGDAAREIVTAATAQKEAVASFREQFGKLVEIATTEQDRRAPLFIFIDELDRCRPTYALEVLECIKHLFASPGAVFVVATDTGQLRHSIKAVYGGEFDAERYLRRFFDITYLMPNPSLARFSAQLLERAPIERGSLEGVPPLTPALLADLALAFDLTARDLEQCYLRLRAVAAALPEGQPVYWLYLGWLVICQFCQPGLFRTFSAGELAPLGLSSFMEKEKPKAVREVGRVAMVLLQNGCDPKKVSHWLASTGSSADRWEIETRNSLVHLSNRWVDLGRYPAAVELAGGLSR